VATGPRKKFDDILGCLDRAQERDRQTDGQTPADSKHSVAQQKLLKHSTNLARVTQHE